MGPRRALLAAVAGTLLSGCSPPGASSPTATATPAPWLGALTQTPPAKPNFTLTDTSGRPFNFRSDTGTKVSLLYFGYTHCPNACPADMATLTAALRQLPTDVRRQITVVFVTTDPRRDTGSVLRHWLDQFDPSYVGLVGTTQDVNTAQRMAGIQLAVPQTPDASGHYSVDHAAFVLVYFPDGLAHEAFPDGVKVSSEVQDLRRAVAGEIPT